MKKEKDISVIEFLTKRFPNEQAATAFFVEKRWGKKVHCAYCDSQTVYNVKGIQPYKCGSCFRKFTPKTGTIMEGSKVPIQKWLLAMYIMGTSRKGISSLQLAKQLGVTQKTAWYMSHRIREACDAAVQLHGIVEVDETYIGGKEKNKHALKRLNGGRGVANKVPVVGLRERDGRTIGRVVKNTNAQTLQALVIKNIAPRSKVFTDDHPSYVGLSRRGYTHRIVRHSRRQYVNGVVNTNSIESFWAVFKRALYGTYHSVSKKHLQRYVNEFCFRVDKTLALSFVDAVCLQANESTLHYKRLIKGV